MLSVSILFRKTGCVSLYWEVHWGKCTGWVARMVAVSTTCATSANTSGSCCSTSRPHQGDMLMRASAASARGSGLVGLAAAMACSVNQQHNSQTTAFAPCEGCRYVKRTVCLNDWRTD